MSAAINSVLWNPARKVFLVIQEDRSMFEVTAFIMMDAKFLVHPETKRGIVQGYLHSYKTVATHEVWIDHQIEPPSIPVNRRQVRYNTERHDTFVQGPELSPISFAALVTGKVGQGLTAYDKA